MFAADKMVKVAVDLAAMKGKQLSDELKARSAPSTGRKRNLQMRLRELIIRAAHADAARDEDAMDDEAADGG